MAPKRVPRRVLLLAAAGSLTGLGVLAVSITSIRATSTLASRRSERALGAVGQPIADPGQLAVASETVAFLPAPVASTAPIPIVTGHPDDANPDPDIELRLRKLFLASLPPTDRIIIQAIGVDQKVLTVGVDTRNRVGPPAFAVGRFRESVQAGQDGNMVLTGHNDIDGAAFVRLPEVALGSKIVFMRGRSKFTYVADLSVKVLEEGAPPEKRRQNARFMLPTEDPVATLITCFPPWVDNYRWIVRASLQASDLVTEPKG